MTDYACSLGRLELTTCMAFITRYEGLPARDEPRRPLQLGDLQFGRNDKRVCRGDNVIVNSKKPGLA